MGCCFGFYHLSQASVPSDLLFRGLVGRSFSLIGKVGANRMLTVSCSLFLSSANTIISAPRGTWIIPYIHSKHTLTIPLCIFLRLELILRFNPSWHNSYLILFGFWLCFFFPFFFVAFLFHQPHAILYMPSSSAASLFICVVFNSIVNSLLLNTSLLH